MNQTTSQLKDGNCGIWFLTTELSILQTDLETSFIQKIRKNHLRAYFSRRVNILLFNTCHFLFNLPIILFIHRRYYGRTSGFMIREISLP